MMKLYFSPFACSLAARMVALEAGIALDYQQVTLSTKEMEGGGNFRDIAPKGLVPTLELADGSVLTESVSVLTYLADQKPQAGLAPPPGSPERYRMLEWLSYVASELHKRIFYPVFWLDDHHKENARAAAPERLQYLSSHLEKRSFLVDDHFTAADAYLTWWLFLSPRAGLDLEPYPTLLEYRERCLARDAVAEAVRIETALRG